MIHIRISFISWMILNLATDRFDYRDRMTLVYTHRLANAGEIRGRLIVSAYRVSAAVIQNVTADVVLHALAHTVTVIAAYANAFVATIGGRHALRVHVALRRIRRTIGQYALIVHHAVSCITGALVARAHGMVGTPLVLFAVGIVVAFV